jgi:hypothetical protein
MSKKLQKIHYRDAVVSCPICDLTYVPGIDGRPHRAYHRKMMRILHPQPDPRLAQFSVNGQDVRVDSQSDYLLNLMVYERARALRREESYDFTQWPEPTKPVRYRGSWLQLKGFDHQPNWHAWLLIEPDYVPIGVAGFNGWTGRIAGTAGICALSGSPKVITAKACSPNVGPHLFRNTAGSLWSSL